MDVKSVLLEEEIEPNNIFLKRNSTGNHFEEEDFLRG